LRQLSSVPKALSRFQVVVVSGMADAETAVGLPGVVAVLRKPVTPRALIDAVRE
jgi:hypothetical protein